VINEVEPRAPSLNFVFKVSRSVETKRNVRRGHQPGNGKRAGQRAVAQSAATAVTSVTKKLTLA
jgi:hypothetical protein